MSQVFDCANKEIELPFFSIVANAVIEHLLELKFQVTAYQSAVGGLIFIDVFHGRDLLHAKDVGRITCNDSTKISAVIHDSAGLICLDATEPDSLDKLTKFFKSADRPTHCN